MNKFLKLLEIILIILLVIIVIGGLIIELYVWVNYSNTPIEELPLWVVLFMFKF